MKAIYQKAYGDSSVLELVEVNKPEMLDNQIMVKVNASSITRASLHIREGKPYFGRLFLGLFKPKKPIIGTDLVGEVVEVGASVSAFKIGDCIVAETAIDGGAFAEYISLNEDDIIAIKPENQPAACATGMLDGGLTAYAFLDEVVQLQTNQSILITGASGSIGTAAIQIAKAKGAIVTAVCKTSNIECVKNLGADFVIDYTTHDVLQLNEKFDVVFDTYGGYKPSRCKQIMKEDGFYLTPVLNGSALFHMVFVNMFSNKKVKFEATGLLSKHLKNEHLKKLIELVNTGLFKTVVDRIFPMDSYKEAYTYLEQQGKVGNLILKINE